MCYKILLRKSHLIPTLTSVCKFSGEITFVNMMAGAAVIRIVKSVKIGVKIALRSCCRFMLKEKNI